jgi:hypothetical protein
MIEEIIIILVFILMMFWIWMIADAAIHHRIRKKKISWLLFMGFTFFPGAIVYYIFGKGGK